MRKFTVNSYLFFLFSSIPIISLGQGTQFQRSWANSGTTGNDCETVLQAADGGYIMMGTCNYRTNDYIIMKVSSDGNTRLWASTFGSNNQDVFPSFPYRGDQTNDGGYILGAEIHTFNAGSAPGPEMYLIKTTSAGAAAWERIYGNSLLIDDAAIACFGAITYPTDVARCASKTADGGSILVGYQEGGAALSCDFSHEVMLVKTDNTGALQWKVAFGNATSEDEGIYVEECSAGGYIIAGQTSNGADLLLAKRLSTGATSWIKKIVNTGPGLVVRENTDGTFIILNDGSNDGLIKVNATGTTTSWSKSYTITGGSSVGLSDVEITSDGGYIVAGAATFGTNRDAVLFKTDNTGAVLWGYRYGGTRTEVGYSVKQTSDGGYVLGGSSSHATYGTMMYLVKTNSAGSSGTCESAITVVAGAPGFANPAAFTINDNGNTENSTSANSLSAKTTFTPRNCIYGSLPVELTMFFGKHIQEKIRLDWTTATETNNDFFDIERSNTGEPDDWENIGTVKGAGNSSFNRHYSFVDDMPYAGEKNINSTIYYRLKQTDFNGEYEYHGPIAIHPSSGDEIKIYTSVTNEQLVVSFPASADNKYTVNIYNITGQTCYTAFYNPKKTKNDMWIDATSLSHGVYILTVTSENGWLTHKKFIRQ